MEIYKQQSGAVCDIALKGQFTFSDHGEFREILQLMEEQEIHKVVFHLEALEFVDSAALGMFLLSLDEAEKNQKSLVLSGAAGQVKKMFDLAHFHTLFMMQAG